MGSTWQLGLGLPSNPLVYIGGREGRRQPETLHKEDSAEPPQGGGIHLLLGGGFVLGRCPTPSNLHLFPLGCMGPMGSASQPTRGWCATSWAHVAPGVDGPHPVDPQNPFVTPGTLPKVPETFPEPKYHFPIYQSLPPDHSGAPRDVRNLIWDSEQPSVSTIHNSIIPKRHRTLSVQTLRV